MPINNDSITLQKISMPKVLTSTCRKIDIYWHAKDQLCLTSFLRYFKDIANMFWGFW